MMYEQPKTHPTQNFQGRQSVAPSGVDPSGENMEVSYVNKLRFVNQVTILLSVKQEGCAPSTATVVGTVRHLVTTI